MIAGRTFDVFEHLADRDRAATVIRYLYCQRAGLQYPATTKSHLSDAGDILEGVSGLIRPYQVSFSELGEALRASTPTPSATRWTPVTPLQACCLPVNI